MDGLSAYQLTPLGALVLVLALPYLQLARGKLHPQATIDRMVEEHAREVLRMQADHDREMEDLSHDRTEWRTAHRLEQAGRQAQDRQIAELLEHARMTEALVRAAFPPPEDRKT